jgi:hypothetical protein
MFVRRLLSPCSALSLALIATTFSACASSTNPQEPEPVAELEVNEAGEYVFPEDDKANEIVCRRYRTVGSHLPKRVCKTRREMEEEQREALESVGPLRTMGGDEPKTTN